MSGRKRAEVESVLKHAGRLQRELFQRHLDRAGKTLATLEKMGDADPALMGQAEREIAEVKRELDRLGDRMEALYQQIRDRVSGSSGVDASWYFDEEYDEAKQLERRFRQVLKQGVQPLNQRLDRHLEALKAAQLEREQMARERAEAQAAIEVLEQRLDGFELSHPLQSGQRVGLERFCHDFIDCADQWTALTSRLQQARDALSRDPAKAVAHARSAGQMLDALIERVETEHQQMRQMVTTARELSQALYDLGYKVDSELMGGRLADGLRVKTLQTAHEAEFEFSLENANEAETDDGDSASRVRMAFNVDRLGGSCHANTQALLARLRQAGIRMEVTDWGQAPARAMSARSRRKEKQRQ